MSRTRQRSRLAAAAVALCLLAVTACTGGSTSDTSQHQLVVDKIQGQKVPLANPAVATPKSQATGTEFRARHILVEKEEDAVNLIKQINGGAKFEDLAKKNSKDPGSAENGGDLDFAKPDAYVPEFSGALTKLKKGEMTQSPVKTQFGYHIIKLEDTREAQFPPLAEIKPQIEQRITQTKLAKFRDDVRAKAKTDYKFSQ